MDNINFGDTDASVRVAVHKSSKSLLEEKGRATSKMPCSGLDSCENDKSHQGRVTRLKKKITSFPLKNFVDFKSQSSNHFIVTCEFERFF